MARQSRVQVVWPDDRLDTCARRAGEGHRRRSKGCTGCHTLDGTKSTGPTWKGLAGSKVHQTDGTTITATDSYLVNVIEDPTILKVVGYDPSLMASYVPPGSISHSQAIALAAYIKTIK